MVTLILPSQLYGSQSPFPKPAATTRFADRPTPSSVIQSSIQATPLSFSLAGSIKQLIAQGPLRPSYAGIRELTADLPSYALARQPAVVAWIKAPSARAKRPLSGCPGAIGLGRTGRLAGRRAPPHHECFVGHRPICPAATTARYMEYRRA